MSQPDFFRHLNRADLLKAIHSERRSQNNPYQGQAIFVDRLDQNTCEITMGPKSVSQKFGHKLPLHSLPDTWEGAEIAATELDHQGTPRWKGEIRHVDSLDFKILVKLTGAEGPNVNEVMTITPYDFLLGLSAFFYNSVPVDGEVENILPLPTKVISNPAPHFWPTARPSQSSVLANRESGLQFIWGPPGTGKTTTLGHLIASYLAQGKKIVAVCVSNIAVDQLTIAIDNACRSLEMVLQPGQVLRVGHARTDELLNTPARKHLLAWTPHLEELNQELSNLRLSIRFARFKISGPSASHPVDQMQLALISLQDRLSEVERLIAEIKRSLILTSQCLVVTGHKYVGTDVIQTRQDPVLVIDEGSMMGLAMAFALTSTPRETTVVCGDFVQLPPIVNSEDPAAKAWFGNSLFNLLQMEKREVRNRMEAEGYLRVLSEQHRMPETLCRVVSDTFYDGRLTTVGNPAPLRYDPWHPSDAILWVDPSEVPFPNLRDTSPFPPKAPGKANWPRSAHAARWLVERFIYLKRAQLIAVLSPFRHQSQTNKNLNPYPPEQVIAGTVHTMQGSEADIVIFDIVNPTSKFLMDDDAAPIINVAMSRAKKQVIILAPQSAWENQFLAPFLKNAVVWKPRPQEAGH